MATWVQTSQLSKILDAIKTALAKKLEASGIKNNLTTEDSGYVLDARAGKTLGDRATALETKISSLFFETDSAGRWGYKSSKNGAVTPFEATGGASTIQTANLTGNRALVSNSDGKVAVAETTATEMGYLHGVTSGVQGQINSLNSNLANFQHGVDALYNQIVSLGVTPSGKTLEAVKNSISTVSNNSYNTGYAKGSSDGYNSGYNAGIAKARCRITAVVGFVGGDPNDSAEDQGKLLYGTLVVVVSNGNIESQSWTKTYADDLYNNRMYYQTAKIWSITVEML